jgi:hypothetical protein
MRASGFCTAIIAVLKRTTRFGPNCPSFSGARFRSRCANRLWRALATRKNPAAVELSASDASTSSFAKSGSGSSHWKGGSDYLDAMNPRVENSIEKVGLPHPHQRELRLIDPI